MFKGQIPDDYRALMFWNGIHVKLKPTDADLRSPIDPFNFMESFLWNASPEGNEFWFRIHRIIDTRDRAASSLPPIKESKYTLTFKKLFLNMVEHRPKVSFDFDSTLDRVDVQHIAKDLISKGYEAWIVTSRVSDDKAPGPGWNNDLWEVCENLGIPEERVVFTTYQSKAEFFSTQTGFLFHLDDDLDELEDIKNIPFSLNRPETVWVEYEKFKSTIYKIVDKWK